MTTRTIRLKGHNPPLIEWSPIHSPNIDALATKGTVFLNAHWQQALRGPSLSLMTGHYPDTLG